METLVRTTAGYIKGVARSGLLTWRGVPYAGLVDGDRRWRVPHPVQPWARVKECTDYGAKAWQPASLWGTKLVGGPDCLNLDIVRPDTDEQLPVVVYFHGGSYLVGSSHETMLRGHNFVRALDVVYVSVNFRLGVFGYLDLSEIEGQCVPTPAMHDQLAALRWVKKNIAAFGGDSTNIAIMGESAGAASVISLMASPAARGLFHKAIAQSAPAASFHSQAQSRRWARALMDNLKLHDLADMSVLRALPPADLVRAGSLSQLRLRDMLNLNSPYGPVVDGHVLPQHPLDAFAEGRQAPVPLLIGTNNDEASVAKALYVRESARSRSAHRMLTAFDNQRAHEVLREYSAAFSREEFANLLTDAVFWVPSVRLAEAHARIADTWMYRFDFAPVALRRLGIGAMHSLELTAVFGDMNASRVSGLNKLGGTAEFAALTTELQAYWGNFIHHSKVGSGWPRYRAAVADRMPRRATKVFDTPSTVVYDPASQRRQAWENYDLRQWGEDDADITSPTRVARTLAMLESILPRTTQRSLSQEGRR
ncbi:Para-nitrobenzyl esterase [Corynebacterium ciconiae DSM 44920]|uniref:carboxylesterase/lipase family protein n=1 Tax=Corynebacterium ciconiae TaxID=227319 RepID=UPI00036BF63E|nr:carboxylesterase/lipase family protein [Corynebacterium ciconiae]WKD60945.1 Para-nitrobenzyl esterase [Corynebacterium ciconiae DSM 44920]